MSNSRNNARPGGAQARQAAGKKIRLARPEQPASAPNKQPVLDTGLAESATKSVGPVANMRGLKTLYEALKQEDFPMDRADIDYSFGDIEVEDGRGGYVPVRELTERLRRERFKSADDVLRALEAAARHRAA